MQALYVLFGCYPKIKVYFLKSMPHLLHFKV